MLKDNSIIINLFMGLEFNCLIKMEKSVYIYNASNLFAGAISGYKIISLHP